MHVVASASVKPKTVNTIKAADFVTTWNEDTRWIMKQQECRAARAGQPLAAHAIVKLPAINAEDEL